MKGSGSTKFFMLIILLVSIVFVTVQFRHQFTVANLQDYLQALNSRYVAWVFIALYAIATILFLPGSALTLVGGLVFGPWWGTLYNLTGAMLGAVMSFLIARYLAYDWVGRRSGGKIKSLISGVEKSGWKFVAIVRLVPLLPFNALNYALGITPVSFSAYVIASTIFMAPGCFAYTYLGSLGHDYIHGSGQSLLMKIVIGLSLVVSVACIPWMVKKLKVAERIEKQ